MMMMNRSIWHMFAQSPAIIGIILCILHNSLGYYTITEVETSAREDDISFYHLIFSANIELKAASDAYIALTSGPELTTPRYEIVLGGWNNSESGIYYNGERSPRVKVPTPRLLDAKKSKSFTVLENNGKINVYHDDDELFQWRSPSPFKISHIGIKTKKVTGTWGIDIVDESTLGVKG